MTLENFSTYTEIDPNSDLTITTNKVAADTMRNDADARVYKDKGTGHFGDTFLHDAKVVITASSESFIAPACACVWEVTNTLYDNDYEWDGYYEAIAIRIYDSFWQNPQITLVNCGIPRGSDTFANCGFGTFYLTVERTSRTAAQCRVYSDAERTVLLDTIAVALNAVAVAYRYVMPVNSCADGPATEWFTFDAENLDLNEPDLARSRLLMHVGT